MPGRVSKIFRVELETHTLVLGFQRVTGRAQYLEVVTRVEPIGKIVEVGPALVKGGYMV